MKKDLEQGPVSSERGDVNHWQNIAGGPREPESLPHPFLAHTLRQEQSSVLSLAASSSRIFSGSQGTDIYVWDRETLHVETTLQGHSGSVLALEISEEEEWLFSSSSDSTIRIWSISHLAALYVIHPHGDTDSGDLFSLAYSPTLQTLYFGCQNTSLQWIDLSHPEWYATHPLTEMTGGVGGAAGFSSPRKSHKFFDSQPRGSSKAIPTVVSTPGSDPSNGLGLEGLGFQLSRSQSAASLGGDAKTDSIGSSSATLVAHTAPVAKPSPHVLQVLPSNVIDSAHYGYIYCMALVPTPAFPASRRGPFGDFRPKVDYGANEREKTMTQVQLVTGSGDEDVKLWSIRRIRPSLAPSDLSNISTAIPAPVLEHTFTASTGGGAVLSIMVSNGCIYAGCQDGVVHVWDLETRSRIRTIVVGGENADVLSLSYLGNDLYTCLSDGYIKRWSGSFACTASWKAHTGIVLSSIIVPTTSSSSFSSPDGTFNASDDGKETSVVSTSGRRRMMPGEGDSVKPWSLITGASDNHIKLWTVEASHDESGHFIATIPSRSRRKHQHRGISNDSMVHALTEFVAIPSVTNSQLHREYCRRAAIWLKHSFLQLGAEAILLPSQVECKNPLVLGIFHGCGSSDLDSSQSNKRRPRVLFYGHYDVVGVSTQPNQWSTPPFSLTGVNGYLYGRGVSDNKGPILAVATAAAELLAQGVLDMDVVCLVEGEEEAGSGGFAESVKANKDRIGHIDAILVSNSYWIDDETPCITYGLRGVIQASLEVSSGSQDLHSGVEGGAWTEPMMDIIKLLSTLNDSGSKITIPSFYDRVRPQTASEVEDYKVLAKITGKPAHSIASRWREPSLTVHSVCAAGGGNSTVIPSRVRSQLSLRVVPDQDMDSIVQALKDHLSATFEGFRSPNHLEVTINRTADWWLGQLDGRWFHALERAVREEWGIQPLRIREGGSIPSVPYLEKEFGCHALHFPMGQSTDQAHLKDERISLNNFYKGRSVVERFFRSLSSPDFTF